MKLIFYNIKYGIINLFLYFKIIWNDRQWDYIYLEELTLFKYKLMYKRMCSKDSIVDWSCKAQLNNRKALRICISILERRSNDNFYTKIWDYSNESLHLTTQIEERDWNIYCKLINQHQQSWWD